MNGPIEYIKEAFSIYTKKENFIFFARIMAVLIIISSLLNYLTSYLYPINNWEEFNFENNLAMAGFIVLSLISIIFYFWSQTTRYFAVIKIKTSEKEIFKLGFKYLGRFFLLSLVLGLIILLGLVLFIIPAIIFGVWYFSSIFLILDKNLSVRESLKASKLMIKGKFWKVFGRITIFVLISFVISVVLGMIPNNIGSLIIYFLAPLFTLPYYLLYRDLNVNS